MRRANLGCVTVGCLAFAMLAAPASADPIEFPFSTTISQAFGPIEFWMGRSFERGDTLTGRLVVEAFAAAVENAAPGQGLDHSPSMRSISKRTVLSQRE